MFSFKRRTLNWFLSCLLIVRSLYSSTTNNNSFMEILNGEYHVRCDCGCVYLHFHYFQVYARCPHSLQENLSHSHPTSLNNTTGSLPAENNIHCKWHPRTKKHVCKINALQAFFFLVSVVRGTLCSWKTKVSIISLYF